MNMLALAARTALRLGESAAAASHLDAVRTRLLDSFDVARVLRIGSQTRGTAIRSYSDLDLLVVLRRNEAKWGKRIVSSHTLLARVKEDLQARFSHTDIRSDQQAAVISFSQGQQSLDVVPALFGDFSGNRPVYSIPDGDGGWLETSPEAHNRLFQGANSRSRSKLAGLCRLIREHSGNPVL